jgi:hypothetical protein
MTLPPHIKRTKSGASVSAQKPLKTVKNVDFRVKFAFFYDFFDTRPGCRAVEQVHKNYKKWGCSKIELLEQPWVLTKCKAAKKAGNGGGPHYGPEYALQGCAAADAAAGRGGPRSRAGRCFPKESWIIKTENGQKKYWHCSMTTVRGDIFIVCPIRRPGSR